MRDAMQDDDVLVCDSGFNQIWGGQYFELRSPGRYYLGAPRFQRDGLRIAGRHRARIDNAGSESRLPHGRRRICHGHPGTGDSSAQWRQPDHRRHEQFDMQFIKDNKRLFFEGRYISTEFTELDYAEIASAFGCAGIRVERSGELDSAFAEAMHANKPVVIYVRILGDAVPERVSLQSIE